MFRRDKTDINNWLLFESFDKNYWTIDFQDILNVLKS